MYYLHDHLHFLPPDRYFDLNGEVKNILLTNAFLIFLLLNSITEIKASTIRCHETEGFYPNTHLKIEGLNFESAGQSSHFLNFQFVNIKRSSGMTNYTWNRIDSDKNTRIEILSSNLNKGFSKGFILIDKTPNQINKDRQFVGVLFLFNGISNQNLTFQELSSKMSPEIFNFNCL